MSFLVRFTSHILTPNLSFPSLTASAACVDCSFNEGRTVGLLSVSVPRWERRYVPTRPCLSGGAAIIFGTTGLLFNGTVQMTKMSLPILILIESVTFRNVTRNSFRIDAQEYDCKAKISSHLKVHISTGITVGLYN